MSIITCILLYVLLALAFSMLIGKMIRYGSGED